MAQRGAQQQGTRKQNDMDTINKRASRLFTFGSFESMNIEQVLADQKLRSHFFTFLVNQHDGELVEFLRAVETFENDWTSDIEFGAHVLIDTYIKQNAKNEINISHQARKSLLRDLDLHLISNDREKVFAKLKIRLKVQLQEEKIPLFLKSKEYQEYKLAQRRTVSFSRLSQRLSVSLMNFDFEADHKEATNKLITKDSSKGSSNLFSRLNPKNLLKIFGKQKSETVGKDSMAGPAASFINNNNSQKRRQFEHPLVRRATS